MTASILRSLFVIIAAVVIVGGGTYSYFSATDTSSSNTVSAGTLTVNLENQNDTEAPVDLDFTLSNLAPGGTGLVNFDVQNGGSINQAVHLRGLAQGEWANSALTEDDLVQVVLVEHWDGAGWVTLAGDGVEPIAGLFYYSPDGTDDSDVVVVNPLDDLFVIPAGGQAQFQLTVKLDEAAGDAYQGESYDASITVQTKQATAPSWPADMSGF